MAQLARPLPVCPACLPYPGSCLRLRSAPSCRWPPLSARTRCDYEDKLGMRVMYVSFGAVPRLSSNALQTTCQFVQVHRIGLAPPGVAVLWFYLVITGGSTSVTPLGSGCASGSGIHSSHSSSISCRIHRPASWHLLGFRL